MYDRGSGKENVLVLCEMPVAAMAAVEVNSNNPGRTRKEDTNVFK
jgi:hypothetical protein